MPVIVPILSRAVAPYHPYDGPLGSRPPKMCKPLGIAGLHDRSFLHVSAAAISGYHSLRFHYRKAKMQSTDDPLPRALTVGDSIITNITSTSSGCPYYSYNVHKEHRTRIAV